MIVWLLRTLASRLGLAALGGSGWIAIALSAAAIAAASGWAGYRLADNRHRAAQATALQRAIDARQLAERRASQLATQYLAATDQRQIITREVIRRVPTYIDRPNCALNPTGLRAVACALDPGGCDPAKPHPAMPKTSNPRRP